MQIEVVGSERGSRHRGPSHDPQRVDPTHVRTFERLRLKERSPPADELVECSMAIRPVKKGEPRRAICRDHDIVV